MSASNFSMVEDIDAAFIQFLESLELPPEPPSPDHSESGDLQEIMPPPFEDDDVQIVSASIPVIDLCSPDVGGPIRARRRTSRRQRRSTAASGRGRRSTETEEPIVTLPDESIGVEVEKENVTHNSLNTSDSATSDYVCPICYESPMRRNPTTTKCGHLYCGNCIKQAVRTRRECPMCKTKLTEKTLVRIFV